MRQCSALGRFDSQSLWPTGTNRVSILNFLHSPTDLSSLVQHPVRWVEQVATGSRPRCARYSFLAYRGIQDRSPAAAASGDLPWSLRLAPSDGRLGSCSAPRSPRSFGASGGAEIRSPRGRSVEGGSLSVERSLRFISDHPCWHRERERGGGTF